MPGKVNPVICESVMQVACQVVGHDAAITMGGFGGTGSLLQLNVAMPMMAWSMIDSIKLLAGAAHVLQEKCIDGLELDRGVTEAFVERSLMMGTSLAPVIGYEQAAKLAKEAHARNLTIREMAIELKILEETALNDYLDPVSMTEPAGRKAPSGGKRKKKTP
jgi:fumarate hydratase class II